MIGDSCIFCQFHLRLKPIFGLMSIIEDVDMHTLFLIAIDFECIFAIAMEYWTHIFDITTANIGRNPQTCKDFEEKLRNPWSFRK